MDRRERLHRCYFNQELDRPGVYVRDGYPANDASYDELKAYLGEHSELKFRWTPPWPVEDGLWDSYSEPYSEDFQREVSILHTPAGDLRRTRLESLKGQPGLEEEHLLKGREDAEKYLSLPLPKIHGDVSGFRAGERQVGRRGIAEAQLRLNPAGTVSTLFGSETFALISVTEREIIHELCRREQEILLAKVEFLLNEGVGPYFAMAGEEYIVPPLHGPKDFYDFNVQYDKPIIEGIHEAGGRVHIHSHGSIKQVFSGFVEMAADVLHPLEAPPMGDITAAEAKALARGKLCLEGNIQIADLYEKTPEDIREQTRALIETAFDDGRGLIVCPTASPYLRGQGQSCLPRFRAMVQTVLEYRG